MIAEIMSAHAKVAKGYVMFIKWHVKRRLLIVMIIIGFIR
jgi:hypothetical protein